MAELVITALDKSPTEDKTIEIVDGRAVFRIDSIPTEDGSEYPDGTYAAFISGFGSDNAGKAELATWHDSSRSLDYYPEGDIARMVVGAITAARAAEVANRKLEHIPLDVWGVLDIEAPARIAQAWEGHKQDFVPFLLEHSDVDPEFPRFDDLVELV